MLSLSRHLHESQNLGGGVHGGKTPYGGRTPGRTPAAGHATPGRMSVRQVPARTPNPYPGPGAAAGGPQTSYGLGPSSSTPYGGGNQTPAYGNFSRPVPPPFAGAPPSVPSGMNPQRAAMIQRASGWGEGPGKAW